MSERSLESDESPLQTIAVPEHGGEVDLKGAPAREAENRDKAGAASSDCEKYGTRWEEAGFQSVVSTPKPNIEAIEFEQDGTDRPTPPLHRPASTPLQDFLKVPSISRKPSFPRVSLRIRRSESSARLSIDTAAAAAVHIEMQSPVARSSKFLTFNEDIEADVTKMVTKSNQLQLSSGEILIPARSVERRLFFVAAGRL